MVTGEAHWETRKRMSEEARPGSETSFDSCTQVPGLWMPGDVFKIDNHESKRSVFEIKRILGIDHLRGRER